MNLDNIDLIKIGNGSEIELIKWNGFILYQKSQEEPDVPEIPLYQVGQFKNNSTITEVRTMVNESHPDLSYMFYDCTSLETVNTVDWDTSNVTNMMQMFGNCRSLKTLDVSNWDTGKVTGMLYMFSYCSKLQTLDLSSFNTSNVISMDAMFQYCESLTELNLSNFDTSKVNSMQSMFSNCNSLRDVYLNLCDNTTISKIITSGGFPTNKIEGVTRKIYCKKEEAEGLTPPENWVLVDYITGEIIGAEPIPLYEVGQFKNNATIEEVRTMVNESHTDLSYMFDGCSSLTTVNTTDWNTSNVTNMTQMFDECSSLTELDLSNFDTNKVTSMMYMFYGCRKLETLKISNWTIKDTTKTSSMFSGCTSLSKVHLDNCDYNTLCNILSLLPTNEIPGVAKIIYCDQGAAEEIEEPPTSWYFSYV